MLVFKQRFDMEKRAIGFILTLLGIAGLIMAAVTFVQHSSGTYNVKLICIYGILGFIFFIAGIGIVKSVKDVLKNDERVS